VAAKTRPGMEEYSRRGSNQRMRPKRAKKTTISNRWFSGNFRLALTLRSLERGDQRHSELPSWVQIAIRQEFLVADGPFGIDSMKRPLEGDRLVRVGARVQGHGGQKCLEIEIKARRPESVEAF
jgi:hypothetical protein